jgi:ATP-dependent helicase/nuclease subunit B
MLKLHSIAGPSGSRDYFASFEPAASTWIVSDLKSKLDLNRKLLATRSFLEGEAVMRASELWKMLLSRARPDLQVVSREFVITLIAHKLAQTELAWARAPGAAQAAFDYLTQLMPVLAHPNGEEMMREWLKANPASESRWGRWFELSLTLWSEFLADGFIAASWVSGVLTNELSLSELWSRPLMIDLGADLDQVEADLLVSLSERIDITVLRPTPQWAGEYKRALIAYDIFEKNIKVEHTQKDAVALTRKWLDAGLLPLQIAIVAPDIEAYWPALSSYLEQEGVPCQKDQVRRLHTYPDIARWLAALRLRTGAFSEADMELSLFETDQPRLIGYDRFKTLYTTLYGREDVARSKDVAKNFAIELGAQDEASRDEFVAWSLKQLSPATDFEKVRPHLDALFKRLFTECPQGLFLSVQRWLAFIEQLASRVECRVRDGEPDGIACIGLGSAENSPARKMIVLGLTETALKPSGGTAIVFSDIGNLADQFGFHLSSADQGSLEFQARWVIEDVDREIVLSVPETDFGGAAQAASWLWVRSAREAGEHERLTIPSATRWDELQTSAPASIARNRAWAPAQAELIEKSLRQDLGEEKIGAFGAGVVESLSPSGIEDYLECPFIFAAKRLYGLSDVSELELEVDASRRGNLMHKLFELLTEEPIKLELSDEELGTVIDRAREASKLELADERLWDSLRARHVDLGRRFLAFEKTARAQFGETKTIAREVEVAGYVDPATGALLRDPVPGALKFLGRIDRIDQDARGNLVIYDYKSSNNSVSQFGSWLGKNKFQLLLYANAIENGLSIFEPHPVVGALYYVSRPLGRENGFKVEDADQGLYEFANKRLRNKVTKEGLEKLYTEGRERVRQAVEGILAGRFAPSPRDPSKCGDCQWSTLCRAPHLSK